MSQKSSAPKLWLSVFGSLGIVGSSLILPTTPTLASTSDVLVIPDSSKAPVSSPESSPVKLTAPKILNQQATQPTTRLVQPESHRTTRATLAPQPIETGKNQYIDTTNYARPSYTPPKQAS
ncbi:hypothetical protein [Chroococcus sp. FPU101]|uniref:hypothetical protein n=1 Tax=Chroococcus sp. FPU101 TaxID=1974212 RepID=UPI001AA802D6|nr:hypothetical protein [Chroococcus sp. FPU101]GFE67807.1 hypothetical protein CFPU101_04170 [Chroococcus sp. FPU101]